MGSSSISPDQSHFSLNPEIYRALHTGTLGDLAFYRDLVTRQRDERALNGESLWVLELGCGAGRLTFPLWELGVNLVGVDQHSGLLKLAHDELTTQLTKESSDQHRLSSLMFIEQDFTQLTLGKIRAEVPEVPQQGFDLILLPYNGIYCLLDEISQTQCLKTAGMLLASHGELWVDGYALPDPQEYAYDSDLEFSPLTVFELPRQDQSPLELGVEERDVFDLDHQRLDIYYRYQVAPELASREPLHNYQEVIQHRYLYPWQLPKLSKRADLKLSTLCVEFDEELMIEKNAEKMLRSLPWGIELEHWTACFKLLNKRSQ